MSVFCINCGKELPDDAKFCLKCGKQIGDTRSAPQSEPRWEYCEIVYWQREDKPGNWLKKARHSIVFWAKGIGPEGEFTMETGDYNTPLHDKKNIGSEHGLFFYEPDYAYSPFEIPECTNLVNALIRELTSKGWGLLPTEGPKWWSYKFRRKVN